jgi:hypothetical protein
MPAFDFDEYLLAAQDELEHKQERLTAEYGLGTWPRFVVDYEAGNLQFFEHEALRVHAQIVPVATHVPEKESLKWAWSNAQYPERVLIEAAEIKGLKELTGFNMFTEDFVQCDESMAWEIAALACKFMEALGAYRVPHGNINSYVLITEVRRVA